MTISRRTLRRAGSAVLGLLALGACKDSTSPLNVTPDQLQSMGETVAAEIESGALVLTPQGVTSTSGGAPSFARIPQQRAAMYGGLALSRSLTPSASVTSSATDCGTMTPATPADDDGDLVPNDVSVTFSPPACHFADATSTIDIYGTLHLWDPHATTPGMALNFTMSGFHIDITSAEGSGSVSRNGSASVDLTASTLSQHASWNESVTVTRGPSASAVITWDATFTAAQGSAIIVGQSLPDGNYSPNGSIDYSEGSRHASFTVQTITPLAYSASCAAGVEQGTSLSPFTAGTVRVTANGKSVDVTYSACNSATVTLVQ